MKEKSQIKILKQKKINEDLKKQNKKKDQKQK